MSTCPSDSGHWLLSNITEYGHFFNFSNSKIG